MAEWSRGPQHGKVWLGVDCVYVVPWAKGDEVVAMCGSVQALTTFKTRQQLPVAPALNTLGSKTDFYGLVSDAREVKASSPHAKHVCEGDLVDALRRQAAIDNG